MSRWIWALPCFVVTLLAAGCEPPADGQAAKTGDKKPDAAAVPDKKPDAAKPGDKKPDTPTAAAKPATHKVEKGPIKIEVPLKGVFESEDMTEVALSPDAWTSDLRGSLNVVKAVEHGTPVRKGDLLLQLDLTKIDQAIKDLDSERQLNDLAIKQAEEELPVLEKLLPLEVTSAEKLKKSADEDLKRYVEVERAFLEKSANFRAKSAANYLAYAKEELRQLEKMYRAKDLTEETEEIILKRQRDSVDQAVYYLQSAELDRDHTLKFSLPRRDLSMHENVALMDLALVRAKSVLPLNVKQKHLALAKLRYERDKAADRYYKLQKDRESLTVRSPADGLAYYGKCARGQWSTASSVAGKLTRGGSVYPDEVIFTIVKPRPLFVRATVEEKELAGLKPGVTGKAVTAANPDLKLPARVEQVSAVPLAGGNFEAKLSVQLGPDAQAVMPGMTCTAKLTTYEKKDALTVPSTALFAEELDEDSHYVYLAGKDGKHEKRPVTPGKRTASKVEILKGLSAGDEILLEKPADKKPDAEKKS